MKALVLGYGRSGKAAEALLKAQGYEVVVRFLGHVWHL